MIEMLDLRFPTSWEERKPAIVDGVLFVPKHYFGHEEFFFPPWSDPEVFGNDNPVHIEYCSGNGMWICEKAKEFPDQNWVAVEKRFDRVKLLWTRAKRWGLKNLFVVCGDAMTFTAKYLLEGKVSQIYVNFPDPWPKARHAKHRIFQPSFIEELLRISEEGALLTVATDHPLYAEEILANFQANPYWQPVYPDPFFIESLPGYGTSFFEDLFRSKGCAIRYLQFKKT